MASGLSPEVAAASPRPKKMRPATRGRWRLTKRVRPKSLGAQKLLSLFDEPEDLKAEHRAGDPPEFQGEDLKAEQPAPRAASAYRPALALWAPRVSPR